MKPSTWLPLGALVVSVSAVAAGSDGEAQRPAAPAAVPVEPIPAILEAFRTHDIVGIGEVHTNEQAHAIYRRLMQDPRFPNIVNDVVVEFGNALYQDVMDRYVRGEDVPYEALRQVWENTTQNTAVWDRPVYEEFFQTVRRINASISKERQLRVLLGGPPINWARVVSSSVKPDKWFASKQSYPADVIRREVLDKKRRALLIFANTYLARGGTVSILENITGTKVFSIMTTSSEGYRVQIAAKQANFPSWPFPSVASLDGTKLHKFMTFDAILYLGPESQMTRSPITPSLCDDDHYFEMRRRRMAFVLSPGVLADIQRECNQVRPH